MARLNLGTYGTDLERARRRVLEGDADAQWALFVVDKDSNLKVQEVSGGTLEDLEEEFDSGKIQYAFARVKDPNSGLTKFVVVSWCGDGVPTMMKGRFNSQLADINNFLKGYHIHVTARNEDDVKASYIMNKVRDSSGAKYSVHNEAPRKVDTFATRSGYRPPAVPDISSMKLQSQQPGPPVSSAYQPVRLGEPGRLSHSSFGSHEQLPDARRPSEAVAKPAPQILAKTNSPSGSQQGMHNSASLLTKRTSPQTSQENLYGSLLSKRTSPSGSQGSLASPTSLLSKPTGSIGATSGFAPPISYDTKDDTIDSARNKSALLNKRTSSGSLRFVPGAGRTGEEQRRRREQQEREEREREERALREREQALLLREDEERSRLETEKEAMQRRRKREEQERIRTTAILRKREEEEEGARRAVLMQNDINRKEEEGRRNHETVTANIDDSALTSASRAAVANQDATATAATMVPHDGPAGSSSSGKLTARVLYDFERGEENEMSLVEGEIITDIEQIDEGWWMGVGLGGAKSGLFPSNYVEVIDRDAGAGDRQVHSDLEPAPAASALAKGQAVNATAQGAPLAAAAGPGLTATALYDYTADEDNELTIREGDRIINVSMTTADWWEGESEDGRSGLFPANYVQLNQ